MLLYIKLLFKVGQDFMNIQYIVCRGCRMRQWQRRADSFNPGLDTLKFRNVGADPPPP